MNAAERRAQYRRECLMREALAVIEKDDATCRLWAYLIADVAAALAPHVHRKRLRHATRKALPAMVSIERELRRPYGPRDGAPS